jgi:hypothetical protein
VASGGRAAIAHEFKHAVHCDGPMLPLEFGRACFGRSCRRRNMRTVIETLLSPGNGGRFLYDMVLTSVVVVVIWAAVR